MDPTQPTYNLRRQLVLVLVVPPVQAPVLLLLQQRNDNHGNCRYGAEGIEVIGTLREGRGRGVEDYISLNRPFRSLLWA